MKTNTTETSKKRTTVLPKGSYMKVDKVWEFLRKEGIVINTDDCKIFHRKSDLFFDVTEIKQIVNDPVLMRKMESEVITFLNI